MAVAPADALFDWLIVVLAPGLATITVIATLTGRVCTVVACAPAAWVVLLDCVALWLCEGAGEGVGPPFDPCAAAAVSLCEGAGEGLGPPFGSWDGAARPA